MVLAGTESLGVVTWEGCDAVFIRSVGMVSSSGIATAAKRAVLSR
jgi:hypothetical protein